MSDIKPRKKRRITMTSAEKELTCRERRREKSRTYSMECPQKIWLLRFDLLTMEKRLNLAVAALSES